jgi:hypothetical protein
MSRPWFLQDRITVGVVGALVAGAVVLVLLSLGAPEVPTFVPTAAVPAEVGSHKDGPLLVTVDAGSASWRHFDFSRGSVVERPGPKDGGVIDLGEVAFDSVSAVPATGYVVAEQPGDSVNAALERWYDYSFTSHILQPKPRVYALRTADGRYAKLEIVGYYCVGAQPGCPTFRYVYQGGGGTDVASR